jgi:hypothetical protein
VLIDALPSLGRDLPDHSVRDDPTTLSRLRGSLTPQVLVADRGVSVRLIMGHEQCWPDGSLVAKLRQRPKNQQNRQQLFALSQMPHKPIPADSVHCGTIRNL